MCVHGLVYDMTVSAARAAALGAGAIVRQTTAGKLTLSDIDEQRAIRPNLILLAGGTDGGERGNSRCIMPNCSQERAQVRLFSMREMRRTRRDPQDHIQSRGRAFATLRKTSIPALMR